VDLDKFLAIQDGFGLLPAEGLQRGERDAQSKDQRPREDPHHASKNKVRHTWILTKKYSKIILISTVKKEFFSLLTKVYYILFVCFCSYIKRGNTNMVYTMFLVEKSTKTLS
jgi:hypothetical protein